MSEPDGPKVILDTNVLFSALARREGMPARVLTAVLPRRMLASPALVAEYRRVLSEPRSLAYLGLTGEDVTTLLDYIAGGATIHPGVVGPMCPDPADQHLWDLLAASPDSLLVTGERRLLESSHFPRRLFSPREFVERFLS